MSNTSASGGYLQPLAQPAYGDDLDAVFQRLIVELSGITGSLVRPRWQPVPPKTPEPSATWCAVGVMHITPDAGPAIVHVGGGDGSDTYIRHEEIEVLASFYGPSGMAAGALVRDNMAMPQNAEALNLQSIGFVGTSALSPMPTVINQQWQKRFDLTLTFRRKVESIYPIENFLSAPTTITTDHEGL